MNQELIQVTVQSNGVYFMYRLENVTRGIRGKTKGKVDEVIICGVPMKNVEKYCETNHLIITNKAVYQYDFDNPILFKENGKFVYSKNV